MPRIKKIKVYDDGWEGPRSPRGVPLTRCSNTKTQAQYEAIARNLIRDYTKKWKPKQDYLKTVRRPYRGTNKRIKWEYQCQECLEWVVNRKIKVKVGGKEKTKNSYEVDHIIPCGSTKPDLWGFFERALCEIDGYRGLCVFCHLGVSREQAKTRRKK